MPCNNILTNDISTACDSVKGIYSEVWIIPYAEANVLFDGDKVVFLSSAIQNEFRKISAHKFALNVGADIEASEVTKNQYLHFFGAMINDPLGLIDDVDGIILIAREMGTDKLYCFGAKNGLYKSSQTSRSNDNRGMKAVEFMSRAEIGETLSRYEFAPLIPFETLLQLETIGGLSVGNGTQKIYLKVDSDKTAYVVLPDSSVLTTTSGVIDTTWSGDAGAIRLIVPKNTIEVSIGLNGVAGKYRGIMKINFPITKSLCDYASIDGYIAKNNTGSYNVAWNNNIVLIDAPKARIASAHSCPNLPISNLYKIIDDMYQLHLDGIDLTGGMLNLGGTTKAIDLNSVSLRHVESYGGIVNRLDSSGVTIIINVL